MAVVHRGPPSERVAVDVVAVPSGSVGRHPREPADHTETPRPSRPERAPGGFPPRTVIVAALAIISVLAVLAWEIVNVVRLFRRWRQRPPATTATRFFQSWQIALRLYVAAFIGFFALVGLSLIPRPPNA